MIALLGVMVAALALIAVLITLAIAVLAFWGYRTLSDEVVKKSIQAATQVAKDSVDKSFAENRLQAQAISMPESLPPPTKRKVAAQGVKQSKRVLDDAGLKRGRSDDDDSERRSRNPRKPKKPSR